MLGEPEACTRLILLRHPLLSEPHSGVALGRGNGEISRRGRRHTLEVMRSLDPLKIDRVFSPPASHCREAAEALCKDRGVEVEIEERLHDQGLGEWEGRPWEEIRRAEEGLLREFFADYGLVAPPGGETLGQAVDRALSWWSEVVEPCMGQTLLLVGAAPLLSGLAARLLGLSIRRAPALSLPPSGFGILDVYRDGSFLRLWHPLCLRDELP